MQTRSSAAGVEFPVSSIWVSCIASGTFYRSYEMTEIRHNIFHREMHLVNQVKEKAVWLKETKTYRRNWSTNVPCFIGSPFTRSLKS
jgi:hypothetical protein